MKTKHLNIFLAFGMFAMTLAGGYAGSALWYKLGGIDATLQHIVHVLDTHNH